MGFETWLKFIKFGHWIARVSDLIKELFRLNYIFNKINPQLNIIKHILIPTLQIGCLTLYSAE